MLLAATEGGEGDEVKQIESLQRRDEYSLPING